MERSMAERRRSRRANVQAAIEIRRLDQPEATPSADQVIGNISLAGVYFEVEQSQPPYTLNEPIMASISVPETQRKSFPFTRVSARSRVVRVSELPEPGPTGGKRWAIALEFGNDLTALTASPPWA